VAYRVFDLVGICEEGRAGDDDCGGFKMKGIDIIDDAFFLPTIGYGWLVLRSVLYWVIRLYAP
jgi:hypothetical protein